MKKIFGIILKSVLGVLAAIVLGCIVLVVLWLARREDPASFLPPSYVAYAQIPSLRVVYDQWLNLEIADTVLSRPELNGFRAAIADARGLELTTSPLIRSLLEVRADVMLMKNGGIVAVLDLGWRGIFTPLARIVAPELAIKGFSFLNDSGIPLYRYTTGATTIHAALVDNVAVVSLDPDVVKQSLKLRASDTGFAAYASRELMRRIKLRGGSGLRVLIDTQGISTDLLSGSPLGARILDAVKAPGQTMLDIQASGDRLSLGASVPIAVSMPELSKALGTSPAPLGILHDVPSAVSMLSVSNIAPLADLYRLAAAIQGQDVQAIYSKADSGARSIIGTGIDELLFSWAGREAGAFTLPGSGEAVFFAKIANKSAYERAIGLVTSSAVAGKDSSLVIDGTRIDRLSVPWYVTLILEVFGVDVPEPYFIVKDGYFFLSREAENLAAVVKAADTGDNLAASASYAALAAGAPSDASLLVWYDVSLAEPFFLKGFGALTDILRLYPRGMAGVRITPDDIRLSVVAARSSETGAKLLPGFPIAPAGGVSGGVLAFRSGSTGSPMLAWLRDKSVVVLADAGGTAAAQAAVEPDSLLVPEWSAEGALSALWAVSPGGTVWRFGPRLEPSPSFPVATGAASSMPPTLINGTLALFSTKDAGILFVSPDGTRSAQARRLEAPLFSAPDFRAGQLTFYPKSFDARVHVTDLAGSEAPGWPVLVSGISFCSPQFVDNGGSRLVTFLTQAGLLYAWDLKGNPIAPFPITLPGVYYATPASMRVDGRMALVVLAQDGSLRVVGLDGTVLRQTIVPDLDGRQARILAADGRVFLYGSGAFIAGYDALLRPLPGFPIKGVSRPQLVDMDRNGAVDAVTAGIDGKIYAYSIGGTAR